ncbi:MAG: hypothetical protein LIP77_11240, partial [Planctomycetes bacterium]|nr:hypothetical protein [Planctomycetota bacterium]
MKYLAIDIGSSFGKCAVLDLQKCRLAASEKRPTPDRLPAANPRHFENDAAAFVNLVAELTEKYTARFADIQGLLLSTQMHGFVYAVPGRPPTYTSWQDLRCLDAGPDGESYLHRLEQRVPPAEMVHNGVYLKPSLGLCNLYAMLEDQPEVPRDGTLFTLGSFIIAALTGRNACHITNAAPLGLVDIIRREWDRPRLAALGLDRITLPELVRDDFRPCGHCRVHGRELPVFPDWGDQQMAVLGCLAGPRDAIINIATGAQVVLPTDDFRPGPYEIRPFFENGYFRTISNMPAGRGLDVLISPFRQAAAAVAGRAVGMDEIWRAVTDGFVLDANGITVDMGIYPVSGKLDGGGIAGIRPDNFSLATLFSAAYLDMAATYWHHIQILEPADRIARLVCAGGVSW